MALTKVTPSMISGAAISVLDHGADPTGDTDSSPAILAAFAVIAASGGGVIDFPNPSGAIYLLSYGFRVPNNCVVRLNGCTLRATTTYAQGTIPTEGYSAFFTFGRPTSESPLPADTGNSSILGDGAVFDMRRDEQTGTIPGYMGVELKTTDIPQQADHLKLKNIVVRDITINRSGYDGIYIQGVQNALIENITADHSLRTGFVGISGDTVTFNNCIATNTLGDNPALAAGQIGPFGTGAGFWNEPDQTWQYMYKWQFNNCRAMLNYRAGFIGWNAGADALFGIEFNNCYAYSNIYDNVGGALWSSPGWAQFQVGLNATASTDSAIVFNNCIADTGLDGGFLISKEAGATSLQKIIFNNPIVRNCNLSNTDSINRAPIHALTTTGLPTIIINNPVIVAPSVNTLGYGIYFAELTNVYINNPTFIGPFTETNPNPPMWGKVDLTATTPNIGTLASETGTVTVANAIVGDVVSVASSAAISSAFILSGIVTAPDTVTWVIRNASSGSVVRIATYLLVSATRNQLPLP